MPETRHPMPDTRRVRTSPKRLTPLQPSIQPIVRREQLELGRADQLAVGDGDAIELALEVRLPVLQEAQQAREARVNVVFLPDEGLQQGGMVGQAVEDLGGGEAVAGELGAEAWICRSRHSRYLGKSHAVCA